jgi:hypothetical protein
MRVHEKGGSCSTPPITNAYKIFTTWSEREEHLKEVNTDGRITFKYITRTQRVKAWTGLNWVRIGSSAGIVNTVTEL